MTNDDIYNKAIMLCANKALMSMGMRRRRRAKFFELWSKELDALANAHGAGEGRVKFATVIGEVDE